MQDRDAEVAVLKKWDEKCYFQDTFGNFKLLLPHIHLDAILLLRNVLTEESTDNQEEISYEPETNKKKKRL